MKKRLLNLALLLTSLLGYLEWGTDQHGFLFQTEYDIFFGPNRSLSNFLHPFILLPLVGQLLLLITLFQKSPGKWLTLAGIICLSLIMIMILLAGSLSFNVRIIFSAVPFVVIAIIVIRNSIKQSDLSSPGKQPLNSSK